MTQYQSDAIGKRLDSLLQALKMEESQVKKCRQPPEAGMIKKQIFPWVNAGNTALSSPDFNPVTLTLDFQPPEL